MRNEREGLNSVVWYWPAGREACSYLGKGRPSACWTSPPPVAPPPQATSVKAITAINVPNLRECCIARPPLPRAHYESDRAHTSGLGAGGRPPNGLFFAGMTYEMASYVRPQSPNAVPFKRTR